MSALLAVVLLALVTIGWFTLALVPALGELRARTDVEPLQLRRGGGDVRHFALGFQRFVDDELPALHAAAAPGAPPEGHAVALRDGEPAWHIPRGRAAVTLPVRAMPAEALATHVVLSEEELVVPSGSSLLKELYVSRDLRGGDDCFYRAVLACAHASLGARSGVLRWIDVAEVLVVGQESVLYGRASASVEMRLQDGVRFQRVAAPLIRFGSPGGEPLGRDTAAVTPSSEPLPPPAGVTESFGRWVVEGDFAVAAGAYVTADLVVNGTLQVGAGARIAGAVKAAVLLGDANVVYEGALVATSYIELGAGSVVAGPIVVEGNVALGRASRVGAPEDPTTISAVTVQVGRGSLVCGEVWARSAGTVEGAPVPRVLSSGGWDVVT